MDIARVSQLYNIADSLFSLKSPSDVTDAAAKAHFDDVIGACGNEPEDARPHRPQKKRC